MTQRTRQITPGSTGYGDLMSRIQDVARDSFGWDPLRPRLAEAMEVLLAGGDVLAVMPTGYGKSSLYQVTGTVLGGVTIVVSPLISLQEDQVRSLGEATDVPRAFAINSSAGQRERERDWEALESGEPGFAFLAPEQLANPEVRERLAALPVSLFAVDEAHCVSSWGHDFRPDYLLLGGVIDELGHPPVVAMTATGAPPVRAEIAERLGMRRPRLFATGFDRPNLRLEVRRYEEDSEKRTAVVEHVRELDGSGLVYTATRKDAELYAEQLEGDGVAAAAYHAGLKRAERDDVYERFMDDRARVVTATSAFGMGIDKHDVRFVVHASVTDSLDSYYQEAGRAGRDGEPAVVTLHYRPEDFALTKFFSGGGPDADELARVFAAVKKEPGLSRSDLAKRTGISVRSLGRLLGLLRDARVLGGNDDELTAEDVRPGEAASRAVEESEARQRIEHSRSQLMQEYAETGMCRRQFLLGYFGEELPEPCGNCDTCASGSAYRWAEEHDAAGEDPFPLAARVSHETWGAGVVMHTERDRLTVFFDAAGYKVLSLAAVREGGLLEVLGPAA
ncbi:RecQ family ATP-dependent DNA helicase [Leifsonia shinshuensis]|uniref:RecQ family ATP-dependent DNA helicase n=1 Tax=Leifsonia shinshuensis TaxID=150026 RepID=UPI002864EA7D|nr:RecQ family ATP-dependent DNA helicase [Leifsonia shinshuensis]MDR6972605.1 ATP-dependent DNA helicase RecQ [Leifsonia shinshuensis]